MANRPHHIIRSPLTGIAVIGFKSIVYWQDSGKWRCCRQSHYETV